MRCYFSSLHLINARWASILSTVQLHSLCTVLLLLLLNTKLLRWLHRAHHLTLEQGQRFVVAAHLLLYNWIVQILAARFEEKPVVSFFGQVVLELAQGWRLGTGDLYPVRDFLVAERVHDDGELVRGLLRFRRNRWRGHRRRKGSKTRRRQRHWYGWQWHALYCTRWQWILVPFRSSRFVLQPAAGFLEQRGRMHVMHVA